MSRTLATPAPVFGLSAYPDGTIYWVPYAVGVRAPYANPTPGSPEDAYNEAYGHGAYDAGVRVGIGALLVGVGFGIVSMLLLRSKDDRR